MVVQYADYALVFMFLHPVSTIQAFLDIIVQGTLLSNTLGGKYFITILILMG